MRQYFISIILVTLFILPVHGTLLTQDEPKNLEEKFTDDDLLHSPWSMMVPSTTPQSNFEFEIPPQLVDPFDAQNIILDAGVNSPSRLMLVSINGFNLHALDALQANFPHTVIDYLDHQNVIIRFDEVPDMTSIIDFEFIEFASYLPYEYKISPLVEVGESNLMVTMAPPFPTNQQTEFTSLSIFENAEIILDEVHLYKIVVSKKYQKK